MKLVEEYYNEYCDADILAGYKVNGVWLNSWYFKKRRIARGEIEGELTEEQKKRLKAVGMKLGLSKKEELWLRYYEELKSYYDENGNIDINASHKTELGKTLGSWLLKQRSAR